MNRKKRIFAIAVGLFAFHWSMILIDSSPIGYYLPKAKQLSDYYTNPLFKQNWSLFAPSPPKNNYYLFVRVDHGNGFGKWYDPIEKERELHNIYRVSYHGRVVLMMNNLLYYLDEEFGGEAVINESKGFYENNRAAAMAKTFLTNLYRKESNIEAIQFMTQSEYRIEMNSNPVQVKKNFPIIVLNDVE